MLEFIRRPYSWVVFACTMLGVCTLRCGPADCDACPDSQTKCDGTCVDTQFHVNHCGACGNVCNAGERCSSGQCVQSCQEWETHCGGLCVDIETDRAHCGGCDRLCESGEVCSSGQCGPSCPTSLSICGGECVNYDKDRENCGGCGRQCDAGQVCSSGQCGPSCLSPLSICGGECVDYDRDRLNCGACDRVCDPGQVCASGTCTASCGGDTTNCGNACVDTRYDPEHCGACDKPCQSGQSCVEGVCEDSTCQQSCPAGQTLCTGWCVDLSSDPFHCGGCAAECGPGEACVTGACSADSFRIDALETNCWIVDDTAQLDSPRGSIAYGGGSLHYSGAATVLGYDFVGGYATPRSLVAIPTLTSDLADGQLWSLGDAQGLVQGANTTVVHIVPIEMQNVLEPGTPVVLSESFDLPAGSGLFAGFGKIGVHTGQELVLIDTDTGVVSRSAAPALDAAGCLGPFYTGVLEQDWDGLRMTYVQAATDAVVRVRLSDGASQTVLQGTDFADMCGFAVDLADSRWCFHLSEPSTQFDTQPGQSAAYCCEAAFTPTP